MTTITAAPRLNVTITHQRLLWHWTVTFDGVEHIERDQADSPDVQVSRGAALTRTKARRQARRWAARIAEHHHLDVRLP